MQGIKNHLIFTLASLACAGSALADCPPNTAPSVKPGQEVETYRPESGGVAEQPPQVQGNIVDDTEQIMEYMGVDCPQE